MKTSTTMVMTMVMVIFVRFCSYSETGRRGCSWTMLQLQSDRKTRAAAAELCSCSETGKGGCSCRLLQPQRGERRGLHLQNSAATVRQGRGGLQLQNSAAAVRQERGGGLQLQSSTAAVRREGGGGGVRREGGAAESCSCSETGKGRAAAAQL